MAREADKENKIHAGTREVFHAQVSAGTWYLELGDIRRLVAAADEAGVPDKASFRIFGTAESMQREEFYVKHAHIRHGE